MKYRVQAYQDGTGRIYYRPEVWRWWFPIWMCVEIPDSPYSYYILEFDERREAEEWIARTQQRNEEIKRKTMRNKVA